jgi:predicted nucleic acid-binding protein
LIIADTAGVLILRDAAHPLHPEVLRVTEEDPGPFLLSPFCLAEIDYMLRQHVGQLEQLDFLDEVISGAYTLVHFGSEDVARARGLIDRYAGLSLSLADASIVVLADSYDTNRVLTIDERDFRALLRSDGTPFVLLPADA